MHICSTRGRWVRTWLFHIIVTFPRGEWVNIPWNAGWIIDRLVTYISKKFHCGDKTILRPSYLHNGISYTGKTTSLYWIMALSLLKLSSYIDPLLSCWQAVLNQEQYPRIPVRHPVSIKLCRHNVFSVLLYPWHNKVVEWGGGGGGWYMVSLHPSVHPFLQNTTPVAR